MKKLLMFVAFLSLAASVAGVAVGAMVGHIKAPPPVNDRIELHDTEGGMCKSAKSAVYFVADPKAIVSVVPGCWMVHDGIVYMGFADGDQVAIPIEAFTWAPGARPMRFLM